MLVYIVLYRSYDKYYGVYLDSIKQVFSTIEKANDYVDKQIKHDLDFYQIREWLVD
jgi:hypothetical protein